MSREMQNQAIRLFNSGKSLGEVAAEMKVDLYDVTFITRLGMRKFMSDPTIDDSEPLLIDEIN